MIEILTNVSVILEVILLAIFIYLYKESNDVAAKKISMFMLCSEVIILISTILTYFK